MTTPTDALTRFIKFVDTSDGSGCWPWVGYTDANGYGRFHLGHGATSFLAHRASWLLLVGEIPGDLDLDHLCCQTGCVNPDHLEPVTRGENVRRGGIRGERATHCRLGGHPWTDEDTYQYRGKRYCRACRRVAARANYANKKLVQSETEGAA